MISEASSRILQRAIDGRHLGLKVDDRGEYTWANFVGTDEEFVALCELRSLTTLRCMDAMFTDEAFSHVAKLSNIRKLHINFTPLSGRSFSAIEKLEHLEELHCNPREETGLAARAISRCPKLRIIDIAAGHFTDEEAQLLFLPTLEKLNCELSARLTDGVFANVRASPSLVEVCATDFAIGDCACELLSQSQSLRSLNLGATKLTDAGVEKLARITTLDELWIGNTSITAQAICSLARLPLLAELSIHNCQIGDEALDYFARLPALHTLWVDDTRFTKSGLRKLRAQRKWEYFSPQPGGASP
jgi:internalin A